MNGKRKIFLLSSDYFNGKQASFIICAPFAAYKVSV